MHKIGADAYSLDRPPLVPDAKLPCSHIHTPKFTHREEIWKFFTTVHIAPWSSSFSMIEIRGERIRAVIQWHSLKTNIQNVYLMLWMVASIRCVSRVSLYNYNICIYIFITFTFTWRPFELKHLFPILAVSLAPIHVASEYWVDTISVYWKFYFILFFFSWDFMVSRAMADRQWFNGKMDRIHLMGFCEPYANTEWIRNYGKCSIEWKTSFQKSSWKGNTYTYTIYKFHFVMYFFSWNSFASCHGWLALRKILLFRIGLIYFSSFFPIKTKVI